MQQPFDELITARENTIEMSKKLKRKQWTQELLEAGMEPHEILMMDSIWTACRTRNPLEFVAKIAMHSDMNGKNPLHSAELRKLEGGSGNIFSRDFDSFSDGADRPYATQAGAGEGVSDAVLDDALEGF